MTALHQRLIDPSDKSHNALVKYSTMERFVTEMCTFRLQNGALCGCGIGALWDLCNRSFANTYYTADLSLWGHHSRIYDLTK